LSDSIEVEPGERKQRPRWQLVLAYTVSVVLFVLVTRFSLGVAVGGLIWAAIVRGIYVWIRRRRGGTRPFMSPWFFVLAALCTSFALAGQSISEEKATDDRAVTRGVVTAGTEVTPTDRCVTKALDVADEMTAAQRARIPADLSLENFSQQFCAEAAASGALASNGDVRQTDELMRRGCVTAAMLSFETIPVAERRFSVSDFEKSAEATCAEAVEQDLIEGNSSGANQSKMEAIQAKVIAELLESGEIRELR